MLGWDFSEYRQGINSVIRNDNGSLKFGVVVFLIVFVLSFTSLTLKPIAYIDNIEQWVNLTNSMFYGSQDFLFSYGPLYWLVGGASTQYSFLTYCVAMFFISMSNALFWSIVISSTHRAFAFVLLSLGYFFIYKDLSFAGAVYLLPYILLVKIYDSRVRGVFISNALVVLLGILSATYLYIRFFYGLVALAIFGSYFLVNLFQTKNLGVVLRFGLSVIVTYISIGFFVFHNLSSIYEYLIVNKNLSYGNSIDMTLDVPDSARIFLACGIVTVFVNIYFFLYRRALLLSVNILLLLFFKLGFGRADHHLAYYVLPVAVILVPMIYSKTTWIHSLYAFLIIVLCYVASNSAFPGGPSKNLFSTSTNFDVSYPQRMKDLYHPYQLAEDLLSVVGDKTVDIYPYNNEYAFANGLNYVHRPSFQNYMTLTSKLDEYNSDFFSSENAPDYVIWTAGITCASATCRVFDSFDHKFMLNEDPLTSSTILLNYHPVLKSVGRSGIPIMLLKRNEALLPYSSSDVSRFNMRFNTWYKIPKIGKGVVKLAPDLTFTRYGSLKNLFFRGGIVKARYKLTSGAVREYRINLLSSKNGLWADPLLTGLDLSGDSVESIMLTTDSPAYLAKDFSARWIVVPVSGVRRNLVVFNAVLGDTKLIREAVEGSCEGYIDTVNGLSPTAIKLDGGTSSLDVSGWLVKVEKNKELFNRVFLTLDNLSGNKIYVTTTPEPRPDVAKALNDLSATSSGFSSRIGGLGLVGEYKLGLAGERDGQITNCSGYGFSVHYPRE